ncbi:TPR-like protein [Mycena sanguinolenta]|uniref:TPR-like protein n=1 Tax=Mycena sanguinolenta TaxID=230812 RepID=A0A8H7D0L0_9AGAR|nr:TPR-like protein [Mycena sanguinolenta]
MATASSSNVGTSKPSRKGGGVRWKLFKSRSSKSDSKLAPSRGEEAGQDSTPGPRVSHTYNYYISGGRGGSGGLGGLFGGRGGTGEGPTIQLPQPPPSSAMVQAAQVYLNHCPPASSNFQGRQAILEAMHQFFAQDIQKRKIYVLYGLGGIGKTQIALKFIQDSNCFTEKFLVDASSIESIETGLKNIAANGMGNSLQDALTWLAGKHEDWLVFFDNADEKLQVLVLEKRQELLGDDHLDTLLAMNNLGWTYYCQNCFVEAEEVLAFALDKLKSLVSDNHPDTQRVLQNLVWTYWRLSKWKEAAELKKLIHNDASEQEQSLEELENKVKVKRQFLGDDNFQTLDAIHSLAIRYDSLGQFEEAEKLEVVVLEKRRKLLGDDHMDTLDAMNNLGWTHYCQNHFVEAEGILVATLNKLKSLVGDDNVHTLTTIQNLAGIYNNLGRFEEDEELEVVVLEQRRKLLGDDHLDTLLAMNNLGWTYYCRNHFFGGRGDPSYCPE